MPKKDFIPGKEGDQINWSKNFDTKIDEHATTLSLAPALVTEIHANIASLVSAVDNAYLAKQTLKNLEKAKQATKKTVFDYLRVEINRIKNLATYTEAIGSDLGVIGSDVILDPHSYKPEIRVEVKPGHIELHFRKAGVDAVNVYSRKKGESDWNFLARDTHSPYNDSKPLTSPGTPEVREYMAIGVVGDEEFGLESDVVTAVFDGYVTG